MKKSILKTSNRLYAYILGLLGFSIGCQSCGEQADMYGSPPAEYGSPHAQFIISGKVTNAENAPIKGIEVTVKDLYYGDQKPQTDAAGNYLLDYSDFPKKTVEITYKDIDGTENGGEFKEHTEQLTLTDNDFTGGSGNWNEGEVKKTVNAVLTLKEPQAE